MIYAFGLSDLLVCISDGVFDGFFGTEGYRAVLYGQKWNGSIGGILAHAENTRLLYGRTCGAYGVRSVLQLIL